MSIGKIKAEFSGIYEVSDGYEIVFSVRHGDEKGLLKKATEWENAFGARVLLDVKPYVCTARLNRSKFLCLLLDILAQARTGKGGKEVSSRDCFAEYMEKAGVQGVELSCNKSGQDLATKLLPNAVLSNEQSGKFKLFPSIVSLDPDKTAEIIDLVFDELILLGTIHDADVSYLYNQWHQ